MSADFFMGRHGDDVEIMRADLGQILAEAAGPDVEYLFGDAVRALDAHRAGVHVSFEHGEPRRFDLVVGADGLHSSTRALAFGAEAGVVRHLGLYISFFSLDNYLRLDRSELFYSSPGRMVNMYATGRHDRAHALLAFASPPLSVGRSDVPAQKGLLTGAFTGEGWQVPRLLDALADAEDLYLDSVSQVHLDRWSRGRVVLVGDAAYCPSPASGQGTSLALVGAYVLAGELAAAKGDHPLAFSRYKARMRRYVQMNLELGRTMARQMVPATRARVWLRNQAMRSLPYLPWKGSVTDRALRPLRQAANAIELPKHEHQALPRS